MPLSPISASRRRFAWILGDILILSLVLSSPSASPVNNSFKSDSPFNPNATSSDSFQSGPVGPRLSQPSDLTTLFYDQKDQAHGEPTETVTTKQPYPGLNEPRSNVQNSQPGRGDKRRGETLTTDCFAKRVEVINKLKASTPAPKVRQLQPKLTQDAPAFQRLRANQENAHPLSRLNASVDALDGEHVPQCTQDGRFELIQCHKLIGYCWCVNKFGQAIKNSAALAGERPTCDRSIYESESNDLLVVAGVSAQRIKNFLKGSSSTPNSLNHTNPTTPEPDSEHTSPGQDQRPLARSPDEDFFHRVSNSQEPRLLLAPYDCASSQNHAKERASKHTDDSIWIPECSVSDSRLYAEKQCHKSKVCWCVDQATGLPLRTNQQLAKHLSINCANKSTVVAPLPDELARPDRTAQSVFSGFSEWCEADSRADFVASLVSQFRHQIGDYQRANPTAPTPEGFKTSNPFRLSDFQVSQWKFTTMDLDRDGKLNDREWNKFKVSFKLVDKFDDSHHSASSQDYPASHSFPTTSASPLIITRDQRRCWRDFLEFCGNGDLFTDESISMSKWIKCTELPSDSNPISHGSGRGRGADAHEENIHASTREAAIVRSKMKNPFLGILKPD